MRTSSPFFVHDVAHMAVYVRETSFCCMAILCAWPPVCSRLLLATHPPSLPVSSCHRRFPILQAAALRSAILHKNALCIVALVNIARGFAKKWVKNSSWTKPAYFHTATEHADRS